MTFVINTTVGISNGAAPQVSGQGPRPLLSVALSFLGSQRGKDRRGLCMGGFHGPDALPTLHWSEFSLVPF